MQKLFSSYKNFQLILGCIKFPEHYFSEWLERLLENGQKVEKILGVVAVDAAAVAVGGDDDVVGGGSGGSVILE